MTFRNVYEDEVRAEAYSRLEFPGTYFLAFRDLPDIVCQRHVDRPAGPRLRLRRRPIHALPPPARLRGGRGRRLGGHDPKGPRARPGGRLPSRRDRRPRRPRPRSPRTSSSRRSPSTTSRRRRRWLTSAGSARLLAPEGRIVNLVSTPEIYTHEWASFSTRDFPENRGAEERRRRPDRDDRRHGQAAGRGRRLLEGPPTWSSTVRLGSDRGVARAARPRRRALRVGERDARRPVAHRRAAAGLRKTETDNGMAFLGALRNGRKRETDNGNGQRRIPRRTRAEGWAPRDQ